MSPVLRAPRQRTLAVRDLHFHVCEWSGEQPTWVLLHGWGDCAATFQFLIDALQRPRQVLAPDQRGFGDSQWAAGGYWFPDYLADLDALLDQCSPDAPVHLIGHSMGGNVAMLYAGIRPHRVRSVVSLEGFGLTGADPQQAPDHYARWLEQLNAPPTFADYQDFDHFVSTLARRNPRTPRERLEFIARAWGREREQGGVELRADPAHKRVNPVLYQLDQAQACWQRIAVPVLWVMGGQSGIAQSLQDEARLRALSAPVADLTIRTIAEAGHMMHHEQPAAVAVLIEDFIDGVTAQSSVD